VRRGDSHAKIAHARREHRAFDIEIGIEMGERREAGEEFDSHSRRRDERRCTQNLGVRRPRP
jgi:hypothetical protein